MTSLTKLVTKTVSKAEIKILLVRNKKLFKLNSFHKWSKPFNSVITYSLAYDTILINQSTL